MQNYTPLAPILASGLTTPTNLAGYLQNLFLIGIALAGAMVVFMIVLGGIQYMSTDSVSGHYNGRTRILNALEGLALVLLCWIIMYTINPKLVGLDFSPSVTPSDTTNTNTSTNNTEKKVDKCPITVNFRITGQQYMIDDSAGADASTAKSKVNEWESYYYATTGTGPHGTVNGCYQQGKNWCVDVFAGSDFRYVKQDCLAGTNYAKCHGSNGTKDFWEKTAHPFSASYKCSYK